ncbi:MAG: hypothetical protein OXE85_03650 [Roseovarius sp.]|nr:hypothetical protein [Roseovarius sp.]
MSDFIALIGHFFLDFSRAWGSLLGRMGFATTKYGRGDPALTELPGPLSERQQRFAAVLEFATPEAFLPAETRHADRPRRPWPVACRQGGPEPADHAASG